MKSLLKSILVLGMVLVIFPVNAKDKNVKELKIVTSAVSKECEQKIEHNLKFEKGIKFVDLDLETKVLTVKYNTAKTSPEKLRAAVAKLGYNADNVKADAKAYTKLPAGCKQKVCTSGCKGCGSHKK